MRNTCPLTRPVSDLTDFKTRRVIAFKKNFVELVELELKHAKVSSDSCIIE